MGFCKRDEFIDEARLLARYDDETTYEFTDEVLLGLRALADVSGRVRVAMTPDIDLVVWAISNPEHPYDYDIRLVDL